MDRTRAALRRVRALLAIALVFAAGAGCDRSRQKTRPVFDEPRRELDASSGALAPTSDPGARGVGAKRRELTWTFDEGPFGSADVVLSIPAGADEGARFPVLIALHGRGESLKGSRRGARGWIDDYELDRALGRLAEPPLQKRDFLGYVTSERLRQINGALAERPYAGLIVVCPYLPDVLRRRSVYEQGERLAAFIVDVLLPRVYAKTPAIGTPESTGIDGVSLGGRAALIVGFSRPRAFGAVGALQAALDDSEVRRFAQLGERALAENPKLSLRLLTSDKDHFLRVNAQLSAALEKRGVRHGYSRVRGTHGYRFNRGPGAIEMLLFHDRALRGIAAD